MGGGRKRSRRYYRLECRVEVPFKRESMGGEAIRIRRKLTVNYADSMSENKIL